MAIKNKDVWELLPWDIQVDILSRLSTKDLLEVRSVCKDWQSIIESPRFHMFQINANPNQHVIIMHSTKHSGYNTKCQIQSLSSNEIYEFDVPTSKGFISQNLVFSCKQWLGACICLQAHK